MPFHSPRARRRSPAGVARSGAVAILVLTASACSGGDDAVGGDAVPTLLTAPVQTSSTSTSSSTTTTAAAVTTTVAVTAPPSTEATSSTTQPASSGDSGTPSGPGAVPDTSSTAAPTVPDTPTPSSTTPTTAATSTTADIEPPPPTIASTVPIPTAAQPPVTTGGSEVDFLLAPRAIAGLQFGASRTTVLNRMRTLLGDPLSVVTLPECPGGPGTALQWFNASVIITRRGLAYYIVGMNVADYADKPVPGWHTTAGLRIGADRAQVDAVYPQQITYGPVSDRFTPFTVTGGADAGLAGQLEGDVVDTITSGAPIC